MTKEQWDDIPYIGRMHLGTTVCWGIACIDLDTKCKNCLGTQKTPLPLAEIFDFGRFKK